MTLWGPLSLAGLCLALLVRPCSSQPGPELQGLVSRNAAFAARLYQAVAARTDDNVLLCPFTLSAALMQLLSAAEGATLEQLQEGLTLTGLDPQMLPGRL